MAGETVVTLIGNLTGDPELRTTGSGASVANFTVAATSREFNRKTGQFEDGSTLFMRCSAWRELADHVARSLSKGMRVIVHGRLSQRSYQASDGSNRTVVELTVDEIGPSLRYAIAAVARQQASNRGAYTGGNTSSASSVSSVPTAPVQASSAAMPSDPWSQDDTAPADFTAPADDSEF